MPDALARHTDPAPAHEAAAAITPHITERERRVIFALCEIGPATSHQIAEHLDLPLISVSPRLRPLCNRGLVIEAGFRKPAHGPRRILWALMPETERQVA